MSGYHLCQHLFDCRGRINDPILIPMIILGVMLNVAA
jgi:hypothetical protein